MYEFDSRVRYSETDAQGRMTWLALMDYFQDCSVFHSEAVGLGVEAWADEQKAWILSSWQICLNRMPRLGEQITTQTWAYGMKGFYGYRNFSMNDPDGERMAYANSIWSGRNSLKDRKPDFERNAWRYAVPGYNEAV